jgi:hypothetical protein
VLSVPVKAVQHKMSQGYLLKLRSYLGGWHSVVGITIRYRLDGLGFEPP